MEICYCINCKSNHSNTNINCSAAGYGSDTNTMLESRLDLNLHTNMPVVGSGVYIVAHTGETAKVSAYNPDYGSKQIPIVGVALQYDSPYDG